MNISNTVMENVSTRNSYNASENMSLAEQIRGNRFRFELSEERAEFTRDVFEKAGVEQFVTSNYDKFARIDTPGHSLESEMKQVMDGFYSGQISKDEIEDFFVDYCNIMYASDEKSILNVYESFLNRSYESAVKYCFNKGDELAKSEETGSGRQVYYDADIYYQAEDIHDLLKEATKKAGEKHGLEIDAEKREENWQGDYLTGTPNFNDKWNFRASAIECRGRILDLDVVPPKDFSFLYKEGTEWATQNSVLVFKGNDWSEKTDVPFEIPTFGKTSPHYFKLSNLFHVNKEMEKDYAKYNDFLKNFIIARPH